MNGAHEAPSTGSHSWVEIFKSNWVLARFLLAFMVIFIASVLVGYEIISTLRPTLEVDAHTGTVTIAGFAQPDRALLLLPASQLWVDTGIDVPAKRKLHIYSGGSVHLAIHRLVETAGDPTQRMHHVWAGPEGHTAKEEDRPIDISRRRMLVEPNAPIGAVLAFVKGPSDSPPGDRNPRPHGVQIVGKESSIEGQGRLYLTVNDLLFEDTDANLAAFVGTPEIVKNSYGGGARSVAKLIKEWEGLKRNQRTLAFYDDNIGDFLVQVVFEHK